MGFDCCVNDRAKGGGYTVEWGVDRADSLCNLRGKRRDINFRGVYLERSLLKFDVR